MLIFFLGITIFIIAFALIMKRDEKIRLIDSSNVVSVSGAESRYPKLPLKNYGIPLKIKNSGRVEVVFPRLTPDGDVEYIHSWHDLTDVKLPESKAGHKDIELIIINDLALVIKEHLRVEPEISSLEEQHREVYWLAKLVSTSELYSSQINTYERAMVQIETLLEKAKELQNIYIRLVREALIGVQVAGYDPNNIRDNRLIFDEQYRRLKEEYQQMKDVTAVYFKLRREGN